MWNSVKYGGFCIFLVDLLAVWDILRREGVDGVVCDCTAGGSDEDNLGVVEIPVGTLEGALIV